MVRTPPVVPEPMPLEDRHIKAFDEAETWIFHSNFCPYLELRAWLKNPTEAARERFRDCYAQYYNMNTAGLTDGFKDKYFDLMFKGDIFLNGQPDYAGLLMTLSRIKSRTGNYALPFSFVSKLVAMHADDRPIYDRHVLSFFGAKAPGSSIPKPKRIAWYLGFLDRVRTTYIEWSDDPQVASVLRRFRARDSQLKGCHDVRLIDFLVWKVGNKKLLPPSDEKPRRKKGS